jgi:SepF-like predicted cell division protein (DUF552 family)
MGRWRLSSQAFSDRRLQPSVDRAHLCNSDPYFTQKAPNDGVVSVVAAEVREIKDIIQNDASGKPILTHVIDVIPQAIIPDNPSHAIIDASPAYSNQRVFRRLLERLREIAERRGWMIEPKDE